MYTKFLRILSLILVSLFWTSSGGLLALPQGESVESGSAIFERPDPATTNNISTLKVIADDRSVINFNSFNIGQNEAVYFIQPSAFSSVLSRVTGAGASEIAGILSANGMLFFVNQNGIRFTPSSQVNVNSLIASTLDISTNNFVSGNYIFEHSLAGVYSQILNEGRITGNNIALVASGVHNAGMIVARAGTAHLTSGDKVTVSFDQRGLIQVEINEQTSGQVVDLAGHTVKDAVANSGTIEAKEVVMSARTASGIFENAVNQTGIVRATAITQDSGIIKIRSNRNIQVSGTLEAAVGGISVASEESIAVKADLNTIGNTKIMAGKDIDVSANITTLEGDLSLIADADLDGIGSFLQAGGTLISTVNYGDITIQSSGEGTLGNIFSAGDLILKQGGAAATFTQHPGSGISTVGSLSIGQGVTLKAANTLYSIGKDLINSGAFYPQNSRVELVSAKTALIKGSITFNDFKVIVPGKKVLVNAGDTVTTLGVLTLNGSYGNLLTLVSTEPGKQWKILPLGATDIVYSQIGDCFNARGPPLKAVHSSSLGNNSNLDLDPYWTGQGANYNWSDPDNWDSGTIPTAFDTVTFDGVIGANPNKNSFIDPAFGGTVANFIVNGYTGVITLQRDLTVTSDVNLQSGLLIAGAHTLTVGGDWFASADTFLAGISQVIFNDASRISHFSGDTTFYDLTCLTPGKKLVFAAGTLTTVQNTFKIEGSDEKHIILTSSIEAKGNEFGIFMAKVSDLEGNSYLEYLDVYYSSAYGPLIPIPAKHYYIPAELNNDWDDTHTWSGTASNLWNVGGAGGNWNNAVVPVAGDDLVFPAALASGRYSTSNNIAAATSFNSITIQGSGYTLAGNSITLAAGGITDSTAAGGASTISLNIALSGTRTITVTNAGTNLTISGVVSNSVAGYGIIKAGNGTLTLSNGANSYTGVTTINAGILSATTLAAGGSNSSIGAAATTNTNLVLGGGTLQYTGGTVSTSRGFSLTGGTTSTIEVTTAGTVLTMSTASASTTGVLIKAGSGTLTFTAGQAYTGGTTVNGGTLKAGVASSLSTGPVTVNNGGTYDWNTFTDSIGALTVNDGGLVICSGTGATLTLTGLLTVNSGPNGGGHITTGAGTLTLGGNVSSTGGATNASITGKLALGATRTFTVTNVADGLTIGAVVSGSAGITKAGDGILVLTELNTYTGVTTLNAGTLSVAIMRNGSVASSIGASSNAATNFIINGGIFQYTGGTSSTNRLFTIGTTAPVTFDASGTGTLTFTGASMTLNGTNTARTITFIGTGSAVLTNVIPDNGTGTTSVVKDGAGTWAFNGINTYTGTTTINAGTLKIAADTGLGTAPAVVTPGKLIFNGGTLQTTASFTLDPERGIALNGDGTISVDAATTLTYTGVIAGAGAFTKDGEGNLILQGANTYSSDTTVNLGTLTLSGASGSALNSTSFTINPEATLILDNGAANNSDRIADIAGITMNGGNFYFLGSNGESASESVGALTIAAGSNYVNVLDDTGGFTIMRFASFSRVAGAMVLFRGTDLGSSPSANVSTIMFTIAPALTGGGGAAGTTTVSIIQGAFGSSTRSGTGTDMVTYNLADDPNGLRLLNGAGFSGEYETSVLTVANSNVKLSSSVAPGAGVTINSLILASGGGVASSANTLTIGSGNILAFSGNTGINGSTVLAFGTGPGIIRAVGDLTISSRITGSGGLTTGGTGKITLSNAANSYTGDNRFSQGTVIIAADADLGAGTGAANITLFGATLRTTANFTLNSSRGILLKGSAVIFTDPSTTLTYNGAVSGPGSLTKDGTGSLVLGGTNTYTGALTVNAGSLTVTGANSYSGATTVNAGSMTISGASGSCVNSASFTINQGGTLTLDNSGANNTNRINDGAPIILNGGEFIFKGSNVAATNATETVGPMTLSTSDSTITVFSGTGGRTVLTFDSASRATGTTVLFRGANLGANPGAGNTNIIFSDDTDLRLTGGNGAAGSTTINIIPYALGDTAVAGTGIGFVTHNVDSNGNINGIRPLVLASEYDNTNTPASSATLNVRLTASYSPNATRAWNCLILDGAGITYTIGTSNTRTLTLTTGALFSSGSAAKTLAGGANYSWVASAAPANEFLVFANQNLTITAAMANTNTPGLTKSGPGTLTLSSVVKAYTGATTINEGSIIVGLANAINSGSSVTVAPTGTFAIGNFAETITSLYLYSGSTNGASVTTGTGILTLLAAGGGRVVLYVNGSGAVGATVSATSTGSFALGANRTFTVNDGNAASDLTISLPLTGAFSITKQGDGTLTLSGNNTYSGGMNLNAGALNINSATALGAAASRFTVAAGTSFDNTSGGAITLTNNNPQTWNGDFIFTGSNNLVMGTGAVTIAADRMVTVSANTLTVGAINNGSYSLTKAGAGTLTLAGALTINNLTITAGTLDVGAGNNAVNVAGTWLNFGVFNARSGTVTFSGGSSMIDPGGISDSQDFYAVTINSTGTKTLAGPIVINNVLTVTAGTLAGDFNVTVKGGSVTGNGVINMTDGTFQVIGTGNFGNSTSAWTFYDLTFGDNSTSGTTTKTGTNTINVTHQLSVNLNHILQAGNSTTWNLVWLSYLKNIILIASGYDHTIALTDDGFVFAWGSNYYGQLGDGTNNDATTPVQVLSGEQGGGTYLHNITKIGAGGYHSVALAEDGSVYAWGYNEYGQLGNNTTANSSTAVQVHGVNNVGNLSGIYRVTAGGFETAAISSTGYVYCWGYNLDGELGNGTVTAVAPYGILYPVQVLSGEQGGGTYLHDISRISVGGSFVVALAIDGYVYSWGLNDDGELGNGLTADSNVPVQVLSGEQGGGAYLHDITQVSAGDSHSLALDISGFVYGWGYNGMGQLGNGSTSDVHSPVQVLSGEQGGGTYLHNVTRISAGAAHSLVIADGGYVYSWGQNHGPLGEPWGQLGNGLTADSTSPVKVLSGDQGSETYLHGIAEIAAGGAQTVTLNSGSRVFNCGNNANGQLGNGTTVGAVDQIRVQAGSQAGPVIQLVVTGTLNNQTAIINIYLSSVRYTDLAISNNHSANYWLSGDTLVTGNLSINNAVLNAGSYGLTVSGNWTNTGGTFNAGSGTVTLNSSTQTQSVTSGGSAFNILTITNTYTGGVAFVDRLVTAYLNAGSGVKKLSFSAASLASPHTVTTSFNVSGAFNNLIELAPLSAATTWYLDAPVSSLQYLKIGYSHQAAGKPISADHSQDATGNTNWNITP